MSVLRPQFPDHSSAFSREQERGRKRDAIISAAARCFNEQGFAHTRLEDVAAELGLTKTSICYYFASKEDLAEAVFTSAANFLSEAVGNAIATPGEPAARIEALFAAYAAQLDQINRGLRPHLAALRDLDALPDSVREQLLHEVSTSVEQITNEIAAWNASAGAPLGRPEPASCLILSLLDWMGECQSRHQHSTSVQADHSVVADLVSCGLQTPARPFGAARPLKLTPDETLAIFDRDARNQMKRTAFLKAGSRLFNEKGFGGTSLAEVAAALGVSRGAFYYHIEDKEQFLNQCLERSLDLVERAIQQAQDPDLQITSRLHSVMFELVYSQATGVEPLLRPSMAAVLPTSLRRRHRTRLQNIARRIGDVLTEAADSGEARAVETDLVEDILASVIFLNGGYMLAASRSFANWSISSDPKSATKDYLYLLIHGLRGSPQ